MSDAFGPVDPNAVPQPGTPGWADWLRKMSGWGPATPMPNAGPYIPQPYFPSNGVQDRPSAMAADAPSPYAQNVDAVTLGGVDDNFVLPGQAPPVPAESRMVRGQSPNAVPVIASTQEKKSPPGPLARPTPRSKLPAGPNAVSPLAAAPASDWDSTKLPTGLPQPVAAPPPTSMPWRGPIKGDSPANIAAAGGGIPGAPSDGRVPNLGYFQRPNAPANPGQPYGTAGGPMSMTPGDLSRLFQRWRQQQQSQNGQAPTA